MPREIGTGARAGRRFTSLRTSPVVMAWRRVSDLETATAFAARVAKWSKVGQNQYANIYDAGTALVGYWVQDKFINKAARELDVDSADIKPKQMVAGDLVFNCCELNFDRFALVSNPANEFVVAPVNFQGAVQSVARAYKMTPTVQKTSMGDALSLVDDDGNVSGLLRATGAALTGSAGTKLKAILRDNRSGPSGRSTARRGRSLLVGYNLLVSDLKASRQFYGEVLGLRALGSSRSEARFDLGSMVLTLRAEPALGLVRSLARRKRIQGDWFMFYVRDVDPAFSVLKRRGVHFPIGIEESGHGRGALFTDPDGHVFTIWEPPAEPVDIDYFKALNRILKAAS